MKQLLQEALDALDGFELNYGSMYASGKSSDSLDNIANKLRDAIAAPEQEPEGWTSDASPYILRGEYAEMTAKAQAKAAGGTCRAYPVYTQPVAELTDEDIHIAWCSVDYTVPYQQFRIDVARAVLAAQKAKS